MSDFLRNLIGRELGGEAGGETQLRPRLPSLFEREHPGMEARNDGDPLETHAIEREATPQPMPWRPLRMDAPTPATPDASSAIRAQAQTADAAPRRASARDAQPQPVDDASRAPATAAPAPQRPTTSQDPPPGRTQQTIATPAPSRIEPQRSIAKDTPPPSPANAATPRVEAPSPPRTAAFVPLAPPQPLPAAIPAQRTRIVVSETDDSARSKASRRAHDARHDELDGAKPRAPASASVNAQHAQPLRPLPAAQTRVSEPPAQTAETVIQVSIGRIEVRAAPQTRSTAPRANGAGRDAPKPTALEDYLRERQGGRSA